MIINVTCTVDTPIIIIFIDDYIMADIKQCLRCNSIRFMFVDGRHSQTYFVTLDNKEYEGTMPDAVNLGKDDRIDLKVCADCGQMVGDWPLSYRAHTITNTYQNEIETAINLNTVPENTQPVDILTGINLDDPQFKSVPYIHT